MLGKNAVAAADGSPWEKLARWLAAWGQSWRSRPHRQLRLCENLSLGERRFLSVIEVGRQKFLVGGSGNSLVMLSRLPGAADEDVSPKMSRGEQQP
ncbi:MAG: flagellar biosynthetic protein FliO [Acidobacteriia bacterium]|nr:flagellar biosynthetic protein FliO [Terriglobia bacterium]